MFHYHFDLTNKDIYYWQTTRKERHKCVMLQPHGEINIHCETFLYTGSVISHSIINVKIVFTAKMFKTRFLTFFYFFISPTFLCRL